MLLILTPEFDDAISGDLEITGKAWGNKQIKFVKIKIGNDKFDAIDTSGNNTWYTWNQAITMGILLPYIYAWDSVSQTYLVTDFFHPGKGTWFYAYHPCSLFDLKL